MPRTTSWKRCTETKKPVTASWFNLSTLFIIRRNHEKTDLNTQSAQIVIPTSDLGASLEILTQKHGFRLEMIIPADSPSVAVVSRCGTTIRLEQGEGGPTERSMRLLCNYEMLGEFLDEELSASRIHTMLVEHPAPIVPPPIQPEFIITRGSKNCWTTGRAGMQYRDLIPCRLGGAVVASHIRIPKGGETPDYVHYHRVIFQMIYCKAGWARLVYEDQGPPFIMNAGDCVLQPPEIRHRVLETSDAFEVIEIACPAVHETWRDHEIHLPTPRKRPDRQFSGQYFLHDKVKDAEWFADEDDDCEVWQTGIMDATEGLADVQVVRNLSADRAYFHGDSYNNIVLLYILSGNGEIRLGETGRQPFTEGDCCSLPGNTSFQVVGKKGFSMLVVSLEEKE
jgi:quercetin dioxygenase-like cupin family protein